MKSIYIMVLPEIIPDIPFKGEFTKEDGFEIVKVGISNDVEKRRRAIFRDHKTITVGTTLALPFTDIDAVDIEGVLHNNFAHYRIKISTTKGENLIEYFKVNKETLEEMRHQLVDFCLAHICNLEIEFKETQEQIQKIRYDYERISDSNRRFESEIIINMRELLNRQNGQSKEIGYKTTISRLIRLALGDNSIDKNELIFSALKMIEGVAR